jgi:ElaB/YqjD/DUF883 family membrane-anchored ribosome-binding protein
MSSDFSNTFSGGPTELNGGQDLAEQAAQAAQQARTQAGGLVEEAHRVLDHTADTLGVKAGPISGPANEQLNQAMNIAGQQLHTAAQQVRQLAPEGQAQAVAGRAADLLERSGSYLQATDPNTAIGDLEQLIRRYPLQALGVGLGLGFLLGRRGK